ncbi:MAG: Cys-tRNA(Pro)/Cys-tRNA(Cys) deacylase [Acidimicrobiales bacterium]
MTPALDQLVRLGIAHRTLLYEHDSASASYGTEAAEALGIDPETVFKTLLANVAGIGLVVGLVPVTGTLDLRALARAAGGKKAAMADPKLAERTTGYVVGGISPFGQRKRLPTFVDEIAEILDVIRVSGGRRGLEIELAPADLLAVLGAQTAPLASP